MALQLADFWGRLPAALPCFAGAAAVLLFAPAVVRHLLCVLKVAAIQPYLAFKCRPEKPAAGTTAKFMAQLHADYLFYRMIWLASVVLMALVLMALCVVPFASSASLTAVPQWAATLYVSGTGVYTWILRMFHKDAAARRRQANAARRAAARS